MSTEIFFDGLWDRQEVIEQAHKSTLQWIHDHQVLQEWMTTKSRVIWAAGKAGCGKSTLSKHLLDHVITQKRQDGYLVTSYFFNDRGSKLQKSGRGFLHTLLYQM